MEVEGLEQAKVSEEKVEEVEECDDEYPENEVGEINEGMEPFWLRAEDVEEDTREPKDLTDFSVQVSVEFLQTLGLDRHIATIEDNGIGIESLVNMDSESMSEFVPLAKDRSLIIGRAQKKFVRASPPKVDNRPVKVMVKFGISRISEISTVDLTARIKVFVDLFWYDHRYVTAAQLYLYAPLTCSTHSMIGARKDQVPSYMCKYGLLTIAGLV